MTLAPCFHCGGPVDADGESTALSAAADAEALRAALERIVALLDPGYSPISQGSIWTAIQTALAALATPAPAAPVAATFDAGADAHAETYRKGWEAGRAEAEALRAALEEAIGEAHCPTTSGGTEGKWCLNHDTPMADAGVCMRVKGWIAALATPAPAAPAEPVAAACPSPDWCPVKTPHLHCAECFELWGNRCCAHQPEPRP